MLNYEFWDKKTNLIYANGALRTKDEVIADYPFAEHMPVALQVVANLGDKIAICAIENFPLVRDNYNIDPALSDEEALADYVRIREEMMNPPEEASVEERIAAALEFQSMMMLPDFE